MTQEYSGNSEDKYDPCTYNKEGRRDESFLQNAWYVIDWVSEIDHVAPTGRVILNRPIVLYRTGTGSLVALEDRCPHRWAPLSMGRVEGSDLRCMYHGVKFGPDGRCVEVPGQTRAANHLRVRAYPVVEKYRLAWIWMGNPARADPESIPDVSMLDQPGRRLYYGSLDYEANCALINDNLLDLSHIAFLHERTLGFPITRASEPSSKIAGNVGASAKAADNGVRYESWMRTGSFNRTVVFPTKAPPGDFWEGLDFLVPGVFRTRFALYPPGTGAACKGREPGPEHIPLSDSISVMAVTPVTSRKSRYFFSLAPRTCDMDQAESDAMWAVVQDSFDEDLRLIEAQQRMIDTYPGRRMGGIEMDRGLVLFRDLMRKLISAEDSAQEAR